MAIRYRSEGFYLSFHLYLSVNVALVNEHANQLCEFGENYFGGRQKWAWLTWLRIAVFLSPVPGVQIVESGEGKKKKKVRGAGGRDSERSRGKEEGRTRSLIPFLLRPFQTPPPPPDVFFSCSPLFACATLACVAGGISVGMLYCFGGAAARRVGIQVNLKSLPRSFAKKFPGHKNPANYAG